MGILDGFLDDPQQAGLLNAAAQMLNASGPSLMPRSFGQVLGAGIGGLQQGAAQALAHKAAMQNFDINNIKMRDAESDLKNQEMVREQRAKIQSAIDKLNAPAGALPAADQQQPAPSAPMGGSIMAGMGAAPPAWMPQRAPQAPAQQQATAAPTDPREIEAQRLMQEAAIHRQYGDYDGANKKYEAAIKIAPEFSQTPQVGIGKDGKPYNYVLDKQGHPKIIEGFAPRPEMVEIGVGDRKIFRDKNGIRDGEEFKMGYSPGDLVSIRGQNMVDRRSDDANRIAASGKVVSVSSDLRKEFDGLPEVKNYKQALPAFTAIQDAAKRNTTQSDINIVYGIAKLYDPNSVVREGEYATVANSPNIPERLKGMAQYVAGGGRLTEQTKKELLAEARSRMESYEQPFTAARNSYATISKNSGADPSLLFPSAYKSPITEAAAPKVRKYNPATGKIE